jgi:hypothetical protein
MTVAADFFAYGSLLFEDIMFTVAGSRYESESAVLRNYGRFAVRDEVYPGIRPKKGDAVTGTVYFNLTETAWRRLDRFEGKMYRRETTEVEFADGRIAEAQTYVVRPEFAHKLSRTQWSPAEFLHSGKTQFEQRYRGFETLKSKKGDG